jgi:hypothetical protein
MSLDRTVVAFGVDWGKHEDFTVVAVIEQRNALPHLLWEIGDLLLVTATLIEGRNGHLWDWENPTK